MSISGNRITKLIPRLLPLKRIRLHTCQSHKVRSTTIGLGEENLRYAGLPLAETSFAIGQVIMPRADEVFIEPEVANRVDVHPKVSPPTGQRFGVVWPEVLQVEQAKVCLMSQ